jgi:hypothetical protein
MGSMLPKLLRQAIADGTIKTAKKGKMMGYKRGSGLDLPVISSVKPAVHTTKKAQKTAVMKEQFNKQKSRMGKKPYSSMAEMRKAKGFKPGESASEFNKRRMKLAGAKKALSATRIGKIVLPIAAAGVAAQQYLKGKMKKDKKMGGGMMQKPMGYSKGGGYDSGIPGKLRDYSSKFNKDGFTFKNPRVKGPDQSPRLKKLIKRREALDTAKRVASTVASVASPVTAAASAAYKLAKKMKDKDRLTDRDIDKAKSLNNRMGSKNRPIKKDNSSRNPNPKTPTMMGGGMMMKPMGGYRTGTMVKARGCKLGRNKPTKIT